MDILDWLISINPVVLYNTIGYITIRIASMAERNLSAILAVGSPRILYLWLESANFI